MLHPGSANAPSHLKQAPLFAEDGVQRVTDIVYNVQ